MSCDCRIKQDIASYKRTSTAWRAHKRQPPEPQVAGWWCHWVGHRCCILGPDCPWDALGLLVKCLLLSMQQRPPDSSAERRRVSDARPNGLGSGPDTLLPCGQRSL